MSVWVHGTDEEERVQRQRIEGLSLGAHASATASLGLPERLSEIEGRLSVLQAAMLASKNKGGKAPKYELISLSDEELRQVDMPPIQTPIFSDIVFRGVKMTDRNILANVSFRLPTARLQVLLFLFFFFRPANLIALLAV